jgi:acetyl esterase/lipase
MGEIEETCATDAIHLGCGGAVADSLDGPLCTRCAAELREADWLEPGTPPPGATLDELRQYAERVSQASGMATVIVAAGGGHHDYVVPPERLAAYTDPLSGALVEALRHQQERLTEATS